MYIYIYIVRVPSELDLGAHSPREPPLELEMLNGQTISRKVKKEFGAQQFALVTVCT